MATPKGQRFGGEWTKLKLDILHQYLVQYRIALKNQPFRCTYIDAFAGSGTWTPRRQAGADGGHVQLSLDPSSVTEQVVAGSARRALEMNDPFERYWFIDRKRENCQSLESLRLDFPSVASRITITCDDANRALGSLRRGPWPGERAVAFLDPYGLDVSWSTMEAIAESRSVDVWLLFHHATGVNRMVPESPDRLTDGWRSTLDTFFGTKGWYDHFYGPSQQPQLLTSDGSAPTTEKRVRPTEIGKYYLERLQAIFPPAGIVKEPTELMDGGRRKFLLYFAAANPKGAPLAAKIARGVIKSVLG